MASPIAKKILKWYAARRRSLPWRDHPQPYAVWVAEIMAQQTRLETMLPYFERWMQRFPDVNSLAATSEHDVLNLWEGLGYYSRARNLRLAAMQVVERFGGELPRELEALRSLPGIGPYTAGAIASLAFGLDEPIVDGNILRVLSRLFNVGEVVGTRAATRRFWALARQHLPPGRAADYNQGLMDLGATLCAPRNPTCAACPLVDDCQAQALGIQEQRPVRPTKAELPVRRFAAAALQRGDDFLLLQRPADGLLGGLWEFPNVEIANRRSAKRKIAQFLDGLRLDAELGSPQLDLEHTYSHFQARLRMYAGHLNGRNDRPETEQAFAWVSPSDLDNYPMGKLDRQIAMHLLTL